MKSVVARMSTRAALPVLVAALLSCEPPQDEPLVPDAGLACNLEAPEAGVCPLGEICEGLVCVAGADAGRTSTDGPCSTKYDCDFGQACVDGMCGPPPAVCEMDSECGRGTICNSTDTCNAGCDTNADCMPPATCDMAIFDCITNCAVRGPCRRGR